MRLEAHLIEPRDRRHSPRHSSERAQVLRVKQKAEIPAAAALVDFDEPFAHARTLGEPLRLERGEARRGGLLRRFESRKLRLGLLQLLPSQLALQLETAQLVEQRARLECEPVGF